MGRIVALILAMGLASMVAAAAETQGMGLGPIAGIVH